ncbi:MAG: DUF3540 domain-containing protein [Candidatus Accumulibacter sp.]|jgi:hypothetical protein|nr:DUF3540 domain-containing protein [Accumulibacter sp.]
MLDNSRQQPAFSGENTVLEGWVHIVCEGRFMVTSAAGQIRASRAAGCLLTPEAGDRVLLALTGENAWLLCVLEKKAEQSATLALPAHTIVETETLEIRAQTSLQLAAPVMRFSGKLLAQGFDLIHTAAVKLVETACRRHGHYGKQREDTQESKDVAVGRLRLDCRHSARLLAENIDVRAKELLGMDAEHIKVG